MRRLLVVAAGWWKGWDGLVAHALIGGTVLLSACAAPASAPPQWLQGRSAEFPEARYLTGQGQGENAAVARDRARADLVKVFEARIAEESRDLSSATRESAGERIRQSSEMKAERSVSVSTARTVEGITIAELWKDPSSNSYHALAVLDRLRASGALREKISELDEATAGSLQISREADDTLEQIAAAFRATEAQRQRIELQRDLRVIDPTGVGVPPRWELGQLESDLIQVTNRLHVGTGVVDDPVGNLETLLGSAIVRAGFTHASREEAPYQLIASLELDQSQSNGWYWAKGALQLTLQDKEGKVRGSRQFPLKAAGLQALVARQRAMSEVDRVLRVQLREVVLGF